jgi:hypothetical protein
MMIEDPRKEAVERAQWATTPSGFAAIAFAILYLADVLHKILERMK